MMRLRKALIAAAFVLTASTAGAASSAASAESAAPAATTPSNVIAVSPTDSPATIISKAADVTPTPQQLAWQHLEQTAFVHFGLNTYDGSEQGTGLTPANDFQPTNLNTDQWAATFKNEGFKEVIITAKHADGFLLFPSAYSNYSVASSSWDGGKGDVVADFVAAMHKYGLKVGLYLGPADLHEALPGGRFGDGSAAKPVTIPTDSAEVSDGVTFHFNSDDYNTYYEDTLYELLTRYGPIDELWWDGANPTSKTQTYDFTDWLTMVRKLQPNTVVFNGPDVRWVGNEYAQARTSEWSVLPDTGNPATANVTIPNVIANDSNADLGGNDVLSQRNSDGTSAWSMLRWLPAECDATLSANHNWYWHPGDTYYTEAQLESMYYTSIGRNCNLLLDVGPNQQGLFDQSEIAALSNFHTAIADTFTTNLAAGSMPSTPWQLTGTTGSLVMTLPKAETFNTISTQENIALGQRAESYAVDAWENGAWTQIAADTTIGERKLIQLPASVTTNQVRLRITGSRAPADIASFGLYLRPADPVQTGAITSGLSGKCLDVRGDSLVNGTHVVIEPCDNTPEQQWSVQPDGTIQNQGMCLDLYNGSGDGALLEVWACHGGTNQEWLLGSGDTLVNPWSGLCLDDPAFNTADGTQLDVWDCNGGTNQQWAAR